MQWLRVASVLVLALAGCKETGPPPPEPVRPVKWVEIQPQVDQRQFVLPGEIKARWEAPLAFRVGGKLIRRGVEVGQRVAAGDELAVLDDRDLALVVNAQQAALEAAEAEVRLARSDEERTRRLFERNQSSESERDRTSRGRDAAEAKVRAATAQLATSRQQAGYAHLRADHPGIVTAVLAEEGQVVAAGQAIFRVARWVGEDGRQDAEPEVALAIPEARLEALATARLGISLNALPGRTWSGRVREIAPVADPATRTFAARISILAPDPALALGMSAQVRVETNGGQVLLVPITALSSKTDQSQVWRLEPLEHRVHPVAVTLGPVRGDSVVVLTGLNAGDRVVVAGAHLLRDGLQVRPLGEAAPAKPAAPPAGN